MAKAAVQTAFSHLPGGDGMNYAFQKSVTRNIPTDDHSFLMHGRTTIDHFGALTRHLSEPRGARFYEFGAGWDLVSGLVFHALGIEHQTLIDIKSHLRLELVDHTVGQYNRMKPTLEEHAGRALPELEERPLRSEDDLEERFGIVYLAPRDARDTGLSEGSVDFTSSTFTLEHIPRDDIAAILRESFRLLRPGGVASHAIDMMDHYSYFDDKVPRHHFLKHSDAVWRLVNPPLHFQNRLRASDYIALFEESGLDIVERKLDDAKPEEREQVQAMKLAERFRGYDFDDLTTRGATLVAVKR